MNLNNLIAIVSVLKEAGHDKVIEPVVVDSGENTYITAEWIMSLVNYVLRFLGLNKDTGLFTMIYAAIVFIIALVIGYVVKWIMVWIIRLIGSRYRNDLYLRLVRSHFFIKFCRIIPAIMFLILIQFTLFTHTSLAMWLTRLTYAYIIFVVVVAINTFVAVVWEHINEKENTRKLPLRGLMQLVQGVIWIVAVIVIISVIFGKSPASLLTGLGAFAAVLMLVFKDSILGVVAGVQLSENDSLHVGDWIKINGTDANGTVIEVSLTSVKVLNWDKTVTTVPPYSLISGSFTNYRTMQQSNSRRIRRSYMIDADSVVPADAVMLEKYRNIPLLKDWIDKKLEQRAAGKTADVNNPAGLVDGSIETNLGVFRAYLKLYLDAHPRVDHSGGISFCFVSTQPQTSTGIPLQIYCFTNTSAWLDYEAIQDGIFEHVAVMLAEFNLYVFENPSGRDTIIDGYMSPGKNPEVLFGMPYPFFNNGGTPDNPGKIAQPAASATAEA